MSGNKPSIRTRREISRSAEGVLGMNLGERETDIIPLYCVRTRTEIFRKMTTNLSHECRSEQVSETLCVLSRQWITFK
jgi:hypothetical protein